MIDRNSHVPPFVYVRGLDFACRCAVSAEKISASGAALGELLGYFDLAIVLAYGIVRLSHPFLGILPWLLRHALCLVCTIWCLWGSPGSEYTLFGFDVKCDLRSFDTAMECSCPQCMEVSSALLAVERQSVYVLALEVALLMVRRIGNSSASMGVAFPAWL